MHGTFKGFGLCNCYQLLSSDVQVLVAEAPESLGHYRNMAPAIARSDVRHASEVGLERGTKTGELDIEVAMYFSSVSSLEI